MEETVDTSGFYKFDEGQQLWFFGPNKVINENYVLERELHETYTYPVDGWSWYDQAPESYIATV
jgi:hypothetical protein